MWRIMALLSLFLAACNLSLSPPLAGDLPVGGNLVATLPPAQGPPAEACARGWPSSAFFPTRTGPWRWRRFRLG